MVSLAHPLLGLHGDSIDTRSRVDIDIISTSAIHQGVPHVDYSLKINH